MIRAETGLLPRTVSGLGVMGSFLIFRTAEGGIKAVLLDHVVDIARIAEADLVEQSGHLLATFRGRRIPLILLEEDAPREDKLVQTVLVFRDGGRWLGLIVGKPLDILRGYAQENGAVRTLIVDGMAVGIVNPAPLFLKAYAGLDLTQCLQKPKGPLSRWFPVLAHALSGTAHRRLVSTGSPR